MIFVSDGVLINGEEIIKRDSREIVCSRRVTIKIENWVDPEARWKVKSIEHVSLILVSDQTDIFTPLSLSSSALIRKCSSLQVVRERKEMGCVLYMHLRAKVFQLFERLATGSRGWQIFRENWFIWI